MLKNILTRKENFRAIENFKVHKQGMHPVQFGGLKILEKSLLVEGGGGRNFYFGVVGEGSRSFEVKNKTL